MQPYFCAYIGYYQLINLVDKFVIYDNIEYTKKGWFNRNRILLNGKDTLFTIPIKKDIDFLNVNERYLCGESLRERKSILSRISNSYRKAPHFAVIYEFTEKLFLYENSNLFDFNYFSVKEICSLLGIDTEIIVSSTMNVDFKLKAQDKVLAQCKELGTDTYVNPIGGKTLYSKEIFRENHIDLRFLRTRPMEYLQFSNKFISSLSIIDVLMFNGIEKTRLLLDEYDFE